MKQTWAPTLAGRTPMMAGRAKVKGKDYHTSIHCIGVFYYLFVSFEYNRAIYIKNTLVVSANLQAR